MASRWFCYELSSVGWMACLYEDRLMPKSENYIPPERCQVQRIDNDTLTLNDLRVMFPLTNGEETVTTLVRRKRKMARPVHGYLDTNGTFHDTAEEADFSDAVKELQHIVRSELYEIFPQESDRRVMIDAMMDFFGKYSDVIATYIDAKRALGAIQLAGQTITSDPSNGTGVRAEDSVSVAADPLPEDRPTGIGATAADETSSEDKPRRKTKTKNPDNG